MNCQNLYNKVLKDLIYKMYCNQRALSKRRNHNFPDYSFVELYNKCISNNKFIELFNIWIDSNFNKRKIPTCDRKDNSKGYSFDNIEFESWENNELKQKKSEEQKEIARKVGLSNRKYLVT